MRTRLGIRGSDVVLAVVVLGIVLLGTAHIEASGSERPVDALAVACGVVAASALVLWRRFPLPMVGVVAAAMFVYLARDYPGGPALLPGPVALALVGFRTRRAVGFGVAAFVAVAVFVGRWIGEGHLDVMAIVGTGWSFAAVFAGQLVATRSERIAADRERADLHERQVIADERLRIAQDLHDSVAHAMATINVQSGVAAHLLERRPEQAAGGARGDPHGEPRRARRARGDPRRAPRGGDPTARRRARRWPGSTDARRAGRTGARRRAGRRA